jgi:hypothetical protein
MAAIRFKGARGQRLQPGQKLVGRNTRWGNPFPVAARVDLKKPPRLVKHYADKWGVAWETLISESEAAAVERFRNSLLHGDLDYTVDDVREHLGGFDLGCPCGSEDCHADVLLEFAN